MTDIEAELEEAQDEIMRLNRTIREKDWKISILQHACKLHRKQQLQHICHWLNFGRDVTERGAKP